MGSLDIETPRKLLPLLRPSRYKAIYGGRGSGKSHFFAELLIETCLMRPTRWACIREVQGTLRDSVRQLLIDKISKFNVGHLFDILDNEIRGVEGTQTEGCLIVFKGMQSYNSDNIKSLEAFDGAWVEEAQSFSALSLRLLRPTLRKEGSELWFSWNPRFETDAVDLFFRGKSPPSDAIIVNLNWNDNPWISDVLIREKDDDFAADPEMAEHVWNGGYERITAGAYFAKHISKLEKDGRVGAYPYDPALGPVYTSWDIGVDDYTAIWFSQVYDIDGVHRVRFVDFFESQDIGAPDIVLAALPEYSADIVKKWESLAELGREDMPFAYQRHFLPHDVKAREWGAGAKSRVQSLIECGLPSSTINKGVAQADEDRINAIRALLPFCEFNQTERVMLGITHLRRWSKKFNEQLGIYMGPDKAGGHEHACDAFGEFAVNAGIKAPEREPDVEEIPPEHIGKLQVPAYNQRRKKWPRRV